MIFQKLVVSQPLAVGGPVQREAEGRIIKGICVYLYGRSLVDIDIPDVQPLIRVSDLLAVRRPCGTIEKRGRISQIDFLYLRDARLIFQVKGVFTGLIREVGDPFSVGRPGRVALRKSRSAGQIAHIPFFRGDGENLATGLEYSALSGRRNR